MAIKIGITGVPGAGKTTLARALSAKCREIPELKHVELVSEYARRYLSKHGDISSILEQYRILEKQVEWEDSVCNEKLNVMISDSPIFLGFIYCCDLPKSNSKEVMFFNDIFKKMVKLNYPRARYDIIFHLEPLLKPVDDGIRAKEHFNDEWRMHANSMIKMTMSIFKPVKFFSIGSLDLNEKIDFCLKEINEYIRPHNSVE
jgi:nicotinamide riboside kinase